PPGGATPGVRPAAGPGEGAIAHVARESGGQDRPGRPPPAWKATPARGADWGGVFEHGAGGGPAGPDRLPGAHAVGGLPGSAGPWTYYPPNPKAAGAAPNAFWLVPGGRRFDRPAPPRRSRQGGEDAAVRNRAAGAGRGRLPRAAGPPAGRPAGAPPRERGPAVRGGGGGRRLGVQARAGLPPPGQPGGQGRSLPRADRPPPRPGVRAARAGAAGQAVQPERPLGRSRRRRPAAARRHGGGPRRAGLLGVQRPLAARRLHRGERRPARGARLAPPWEAA